MKRSRLTVNIPLPRDLTGSYESIYWSLLRMQSALNQDLLERYEQLKDKGRHVLVDQLLSKTAAQVDLLNAHGYQFTRKEYYGDIDFENSEQWYVDEHTNNAVIVLHYKGYSVQARMEHSKDSLLLPSSDELTTSIGKSAIKRS